MSIYGITQSDQTVETVLDTDKLTLKSLEIQ